MKYKLIKEYPGSPKLGTVVIKNNDFGGYSYIEPNIQEYSKGVIEQYPEFWEEVVEKDYEILSLIEGKFIYPCDKYSKDYINQLFNTLGVSIHSVKRLSDSEIFTIGDKIQLDNDNKEFGTITELYISHEQLRFYCGRLGGVICHDVDKRNNFTKLKQKLFTTEDGVDIFEGDKYFICTASLSNCINNEGIVGKFFKPNPNYKYFSTKEKAEEYILMNKPCLSLNDVILEANRINKNKGFIKAKLGQSLKELVNTKING